MFELVSRAGATLRPKLGVPPVSTEEAGGVRAMLPTNPEAARLYSQALSKLRVFDAIAARNLLHESIAIEPYFAPAHSALAAAWKMLGYEKDAKEEAQKAYKLASNLPREEQLSVEARYRELSTPVGRGHPSLPNALARLPRQCRVRSPSGVGAEVRRQGKGLAHHRRDVARTSPLLAATIPGLTWQRHMPLMLWAISNNRKKRLPKLQRNPRRWALATSSPRQRPPRPTCSSTSRTSPPRSTSFDSRTTSIRRSGDTSGVTSSLGNIASVLQEQGQLAEVAGNV